MFCPLSHVCISLTFQRLICFTVSLLGSFIGLSAGISCCLLSRCPLVSTFTLSVSSSLICSLLCSLGFQSNRCLSPYVPCHFLLFSSVKLTKVSRSVVSPCFAFFVPLSVPSQTFVYLFGQCQGCKFQSQSLS